MEQVQGQRRHHVCGGRLAAAVHHVAGRASQRAHSTHASRHPRLQPADARQGLAGRPTASRDLHREQRATRSRRQ